MSKSTVVELDFCYSFGKTIFRYEQARLPKRPNLTLLNQYSKAQLVELINQMVAYEPDLEMFLQPPQVELVPSPLPTQTEEQKNLQRQIRHAFHQAVGKWGEVYALSLTLLDLAKIGDKYMQTQNWPEAVAVYHTLIAEILEQRDLVDDHEGDLAKVISRCVTGLHQCFKVTSDPALRQTILDTLARTASWDVDENSVEVTH